MPIPTLPWITSAPKNKAAPDSEKDRPSKVEATPAAVPAGSDAENQQELKPRIETYSDSEDEAEFRQKRESSTLDGNAEPKDEPSTSLAKWMRKEGDSRSRNVGGHQRGRIQWPWRVPQIEPIQIQDKGWSSRRVALACRRTWQAHWQAVGAAPAWTWLLRLTLLALFHRFRPKLAARLELFCLAIPFMDALGALLGQEACSLSLPGGLRRIGRQAALGTWPCLALSAWRGATSWRVERRPRPRLKRTTSMCVAELAKDFDERESRRSSLQLSIEGVQEGLALAQSYSTELAELRRILSSSGTRLPPNRFDETGAELMRFAAAAGIEKATGAEASAVALEEAAHRVYATIRWARKQRFMPLAQLKQWTHVVQYEGRDEQGHPIMLVRAAQACELRQGRPSEQAVQAIVSMVEYITHTVMEEGGGSDRMLVVVDACDASTLHVTRKVSRIKGLVLTLMQHYPNRLHRLDIVGLPPVLRWVYTTLRPQLANITAAKVRMCEPGDTTVPVLVGQGLTSKKRTLSAPSRIYEAIAKEAVAEGDLALAGTPRRVRIPDKPVVLDNGMKHQPSPKDQLKRVPSILRSSLKKQRSRLSETGCSVDEEVPVFPDLSFADPPASSTASPTEEVPAKERASSWLAYFVFVLVLAIFVTKLRLQQASP